MSSIDTFGRAISPRMPDIGIRRRGVVSGRPQPSEDLDAYVKELASRSSAEVGANTRHLISDFTTPLAAGEPIATNPSGVGSFFIWVTAAGQVKRLWLSGVASDGASGITDCTRIQAVPPQTVGGLEGYFIFYFSSGNPRLSADYGATLGSAWATNVADVWFDETNNTTVYREGANVYTQSGLPITAGILLGLFSSSAYQYQHQFGINTDMRMFFSAAATGSVGAAGLPGYHVVRPDPGNVAARKTLTPPTGLSKIVGVRALYMKGLWFVKWLGSGGAVFGTYYADDADIIQSGVVTPNVALSTTSAPFIVGNLVFDEDAAGDWLWYSSDLITWHPHSPLNVSGIIRQAVGDRLLTGEYISGPCI